MNSPAIECYELGKKFGDIWGIEDITFRANKGELTVLVGPNGAGKTTTIRILATYYRPTKGKAYVLGFDVTREYKEIRSRIAYLPQEYSPPYEVTPEEFVVWGLVLRGMSLSEAKRTAKEWISKLKLEKFKDRPHRTLSGGERRRSAIAFILSSGAEIMFLDEPTVGLDPEIKRIIWGVIRETVKMGTAILLTTHDMHEAQVLADKVIMIHHGRVLREGTPLDILKNLPYSYKVILRSGAHRKYGYPHALLGDREIVYFRSRSEAINFISELNEQETVNYIGPVDLEDAYIYLINGGFDEN